MLRNDCVENVEKSSNQEDFVRCIETILHCIKQRQGILGSPTRTRSRPQPFQVQTDQRIQKQNGQHEIDFLLSLQENFEKQAPPQV